MPASNGCTRRTLADCRQCTDQFRSVERFAKCSDRTALLRAKARCVRHLSFHTTNGYRDPTVTLTVPESSCAISTSSEVAFTGLGADGFAGFSPSTPIDQGRSAYAGFIDLELSPAERLKLAAALRYDDYDDFGDATTWKFSARTRLIDALAARATAGTGFRAPSLQQQEFRAVAGALSASQVVSVGTLPVRDPSARALDASDLKPEKSDNFSAGFVFAPNTL